MASTRLNYAGPPSTGRAKALRSSEVQIVRDDLSGLLAHDLKTPLAAISMNLDFALGELDPDISVALRAALADCRQANTRAIRIVSDMADAVRLTVGERLPVFTETRLRSVIEGVVERALDEAKERGVYIDSTVDDTVVQADGELLCRALDRLLERALRHARAASHIAIDQCASVVSIRVQTLSDGRGELATRTLATYFAEAAVVAQGGAVEMEKDGAGNLVYRVLLAR